MLGLMLPALLAATPALAAPSAALRHEGAVGYTGLPSSERLLSNPYREYTPEKELPQPFLPVMPTMPSMSAPSPSEVERPDDLRDSPGAARPPAAGWKLSPSSLLLTGRDGRVVNELGLGAWDLPASGPLPSRREARGGVSQDGRSAWYWQKIQTRPGGAAQGRSEALRALVFLDGTGKILWRDDESDRCGKVGPLVLSRDGETSLLLRRRGTACSVEVRLRDGRSLMAFDCGQRVEGAEIGADGRYAWVLWGGTEAPMTYSFLDLRGRRRRDLPAVEAVGAVRLMEDGSFTDGKKVLHSFD